MARSCGVSNQQIPTPYPDSRLRYQATRSRTPLRGPASMLYWPVRIEALGVSGAYSAAEGGGLGKTVHHVPLYIFFFQNTLGVNVVDSFFRDQRVSVSRYPCSLAGGAGGNSGFWLNFFRSLYPLFIKKNSSKVGINPRNPRTGKKAQMKPDPTPLHPPATYKPTCPQLQRRQLIDFPLQ
jgi:hypothetical protein